jgi:uncharacterized repeat protein (TIGR02543 family)
MSFIKNFKLFLCMLLLITCSKESDVSSDAYASSASQNTYTPPNTTTAPTVTQFTLAVTATNGGGVSSTGGTYDNGTSVSITATPNEGYEFVGWNGTDMSSSTITITLTANTTIEALFSQVSTTTTVIQFTLAVSASNGGTVSTEGGDFEEGTEVTITATANAGYRFTGWEGSDSTSESLTVTLNSDQTYQALFELIPVYTLSVTTSAEGGTVSTEGGDFEEGTEVTITATANAGYRFTGWEGSDSTSESLTVTLNSDQTYQALFELIPVYTLSVTTSAEGGTVSTEGGDFEEGTEVTITATANAGYRFTGWEGSDSTSESLTVTLNSDQTYQALFELIPDFEEGTEVTITATANAGYRFTGWEGSDSTSESLTVTLNSDQTYQALFELIPASVYTISVSAQGSANYILTGDDANGSVSGNDPSVSLKVGDTINFDVSAQGHPFYLIKTSDGGFGSGNLIDGVSNNGAQSATVSWTPTEAGTYYYICEYHPSMLGTITVTE